MITHPEHPNRLNTNSNRGPRFETAKQLSKAVGEPPFMLAISVYEALRDAVGSTKADGQLVEMNAPATAESVLKAIA